MCTVGRHLDPECRNRLRRQLTRRHRLSKRIEHRLPQLIFRRFDRLCHNRLKPFPPYSGFSLFFVSKTTA